MLKLRENFHLLSYIKRDFHYTNFHETQKPLSSIKADIYTEFHHSQSRNVEGTGKN
jgi:hypothetical protein